MSHLIRIASSMAAVTYFIAGRSNCPFFAKAQRIGEIIQKNLPSVDVRIISKHPTEWTDYLKGLCERLQFKHGGSPIIYNQLGILIGGSDAFLALIRKLYGNFIEFPTSVLSDYANENLEASEQALAKKGALEKRRMYEEQWSLRNQRLHLIGTQAVNLLTTYTTNAANWFQLYQRIKATLIVANKRYKLPADAEFFHQYLTTLPQLTPKIDQVKEEIANLLAQAENLDNVPSIGASTTAKQHFSKTPDPIWKYQILEHHRILTEFSMLLTRLHKSRDKIQMELAVLLKPPQVRATTADHAFRGSKVESEKTDLRFSMPNPRKEETPESPKHVDLLPVESALRDALLEVEEGLDILRRCRKQLRTDLASAAKDVYNLRQVLSVDEFRPFKLRERKEIARNIHLFRFDLPSATDTLGCPIGQHVFVKIPEMERPYSPITTDSDLGYFDIVVKVARDTPMMEYFSSLNAGDWVPIRGPAGSLVVKKEEVFSGVSMFAHGVGITPMLQMVRHFLSYDGSFPIWLLYFNNSEDQVLLKDELERLSANHTRFNLRYISTKAGKSWEELQPQDLVASLPFRPPGFKLSKEQKPFKVFICGPKSFTKKTKTLLEELGHNEEEVFLF